LKFVGERPGITNALLRAIETMDTIAVNNNINPMNTIIPLHSTILLKFVWTEFNEKEKHTLTSKFDSSLEF
jgi:hypothetical protein